MKRKGVELTVIASIIGVFGIFVICVLMVYKFVSESRTIENDTTQETVKVEAETLDHTHDWQEVAIEAATIIETKELRAVASEGIPVVYLTRYRSKQNGLIQDEYIVYDAALNDIRISENMPNIHIEVEYITDGTPRLEVYEHGKPICSICEARLLSYQLRTYKFYIPEGTLLIHWE